MKTSDLSQFLRELWQQGVEFWLEDGQLRFRGNKNLISGNNLEQLRNKKAAITGLIEADPQAYLGFPLSHGQRSIYLMQHLVPDSTAYNLMALLQLREQPDLQILQDSIHTLLQRHAPLRMAIKTLDGHLAQQPCHDLPDIFSLVELPCSDQQELLHWASQQADQPFDLENEALIRIRLLHNPDNDTWHLLLVAHHIIADFWAMDILVRELDSLYQSVTGTNTQTLPATGKLYKDYVLHEQEWLNSEAGLAAKHYWHEQLRSLPSLLELPADHKRPQKTSLQGEEYRFAFGEELTTRLKEHARHAHITPFIWIFSTYQVLLHRYTGEDRIAIGSPMACRNLHDFQLLAGHFTNPVILLSDFSKTNTFTKVLSHNKQQLLQAMKHQDYPLQCLLEDLQSLRENPSEPLFQTAISWNQMADNVQDDNSLIEKVLLTEQRGAIYDLVLTGYDKGNDIELSLRFSTDLFMRSSIERLSRHFLHLLESSIDGSYNIITEVDFRTAEEKAMVDRLNASQRPIATHTNLAKLFSNTAAQYPGFIALKEHNTQFTYSQLEKSSNRLANYFTSQGIHAGQHIALCLHRSYDMLNAILAVLKTGCTYVPIDTSYPNDRIAYMAQQTEAPLLLSSKDLGAKFSELQQHAAQTAIIYIEDIKQDLPAYSDEFNHYRDGYCEEDDVACVLFTSGSTGKPKGVKTPHRAVIRLCTNTNFFAVNPADKVCYLSNISFDATNIEIWGSFLNGGCLLTVDHDTLLTPSLFSAFLEHEKPQVALITTALFNVFVSHQPDMFRHFSYLLVGGEALDINPVRRCVEHGKPQHLINIYGPTENGTISTTYDIFDVNIQYIPIGKTISNSQAYVHDKYGIPAPLNVMGEIFVGGEGIATGYQNQPELTAERFQPDHYHGKGLLYATGDLGYFREDGELMYAGRSDDQVKIRGYRIELGEIEQCLSQHPDINECCIVVIKEHETSTLAAYYASHTAIDSASIKAFLRQFLPEFMIPSALLQMPALPINANGKVDKRQLPVIRPEQTTGTYTAPRNSTEETIASIWQQQLKQDKIGIDDNFFDIGGHSLLAIRTASALQNELGVEVSMRMLFEYPSIATLAQAISDTQATDKTIIPVIAPGIPVPASLSQQRLWFLQQLNPLSTAYNMPVALRINKGVDAAHIEWCIKTLLRRHDALRTSLADNNGIAYLHVHDTDNWQLPVIDLSHHSLETAEELAKNELRQLANHVFSLNGTLLLQCALLKLSGNRNILAFCLHHLIADGLSINILLGELAQLWQHKADTLPALAISYRDYSAWQHESVKTPAFKQQIEFWQQQLADAPAMLNLPTDKPRPAVSGSAGAEVAFTIPATTVSQLKKLGQHNGATLFMTLLAAYSLLLSRYSQQKDLCIGFPIAGRTGKALESLAGLFVNNLIVRCNLAENTSINDYIRQVKQTSINAFSHQDVPFDLIIDALKIERSLSYVPFLQASFSLEDSHFSDKLDSLMGTDVCHEKLDWHVAKYDVHLSCFETNDQHLLATIEYNTELFEADTIERMGRHYLALLDAIVANPAALIDDINFLSGEEYRQQMDFSQGWNATFHAYPPAASLHELIEAQAEATPAAIALVDEQQQLDYQDMNAAANRLAYHLRALGIHRNQPVAVCLERSVHMSIALLAILKAGGTYVPLTTDIPGKRIAYICQDTGTKVLVSHSSLQFPADFAITAQRVDIDNDAAWQHLPASNPEACNLPDDLFNIIYTSGSTGNPKGVMVPHRGIINRLRWMQQAYPIGSADRVLQKTPFNFDVSVWELFWPLMQGSTLVFARPEGHKDPQYIRDTVISANITTLHFVPSMLGIFLQQDDIARCTSLRQVFTSGEALQLNHAREFFRHLPDTGLFNLYGPTEASIDVSYYNCTADEQHSCIAIGKPIHNTQLHILDQAMNVLPIGVAGDLYIGGEGLATGYWNQPGLTAQAFVNNPWYSQGHPSKRLYKTGDIARYRSDGNIEYLGRSDHQVKIRGLRIEPGEIEAALGQISGIKEAIVTVQENHGSQRLVAYLLGDDATVDTGLIVQALKNRLPEYMIPAAFVVLAEWPLSSNGKIDRKRLPAPQTDSSAAYLAPRNATEQTLADIWQSLLGLEKVGIHDNFFELGGHSLLATQMASRIRTALHCTLELKAIFEHPTIATLAVHLLENTVNALDIDDAQLLALLDEIEDEIP